MDLSAFNTQTDYLLIVSALCPVPSVILSQFLVSFTNVPIVALSVVSYTNWGMGSQIFILNSQLNYTKEILLFKLGKNKYIHKVHSRTHIGHRWQH